MTKVVRDKNTKKSLGYGFVKFGKEYESLHALEKMNGYILGHKVLKVSIARPPSLEIRNCKLYVTNLPKEYTEREVIALFKEVMQYKYICVQNFLTYIFMWHKQFCSLGISLNAES